MVVLPVAMPVTTPATTEATAGYAEDQLPPDVASVRVVVDPVQRLSPPLMGAGAALMVMVAVVVHPVGRV